jgi:hypothetical protein
MDDLNKTVFNKKEFYSTFDKIKLPHNKKDLDVETRIDECLGMVSKNTKLIASQVKGEQRNEIPSFYSVLKLGYKKMVLNNQSENSKIKSKSKVIASIFKTKPRSPKNYILANQIKSQIKSRNKFFNMIHVKMNQESQIKNVSKTQRDNIVTISDTSDYYPSIRETNYSSQRNNRLHSSESFLRRPKNNKEIFLTHIIPKRKKSGIDENLFFDIGDKKVKSLSHSKNNSKIPKLEKLNFFTLNTQVQTVLTESNGRKLSDFSIRDTSRSHLYRDEKRTKQLNIKMSNFNKKINCLIKSYDNISQEINTNRIMSKEKIYQNSDSLRETLKINPKSKLLDVITNFSGINNYIDKGKADFIRYSDTLANMNSSFLYNRRSDYFDKYEDYARAANVKEFYDKEYHLVGTEKLSQNHLKIKKTIKSIILTKKKVLKNN